MTADGEKFVLRSTLTSPYGRKVRIAADVLGLSNRMTTLPANTLDESDTLRDQNPLGKMPCLLLAGGGVLYDSRVIVEFLQEVAGSHRLVPPRGLSRYQALTQAALADGISDAALLMVYESRFRDAPSARWLEHQRGKVIRALDAFAATPPDPAVTDIVSIGLACALGYLDWRRPLAWRTTHSSLAAWLTAFARHEPAVERTYAEEPA